MLKMLAESSAKGLRLAVGAPAKIMDSTGAPQDASSHPLTRQEILQLIGRSFRARAPACRRNHRRIRSRVAKRRVQGHDFATIELP
jgi:hypothetical protein